jgi:hypothetical protein
MKKYLIIALASASLLSCSTGRKAAEAIAKKAGEEALASVQADAAKTPEQKLQELYAAHPSLLTKPVRSERQVDTVKTKPVAVEMTVAPTSSPAVDRVLADSLFVVLDKLGAIDSTISAAQRQRAAESIAHTLSTRPAYSRDTATTVVENVEVRAWFDRMGKLRVSARKFGESIPVVKKTDVYEPIREPTFWEKVWFSIRIIGGLLGIVGIILLFLFIKRRSKNE